VPITRIAPAGTSASGGVGDEQDAAISSAANIATRRVVVGTAHPSFRIIRRNDLRRS